MRQLILIAGIVAILMYGAAVGQKGIPALAAPHEVGARVPSQSLAALQRSLEAAGAPLTQAVITGWAEVQGPGDKDRVEAALGWKGSAPEGETRTVSIRAIEGHSYATVRWVLSGKAAARWQVAAKAVQAGLASAKVTVQLEGVTESEGLTELAGKALGAVGATDRQPWSDLRAASVAGRTTQLPPGPFGVNIQVAVRRDAAREQTRVWVAWPALLQEY